MTPRVAASEITTKRTCDFVVPPDKPKKKIYTKYAKVSLKPAVEASKPPRTLSQVRENEGNPRRSRTSLKQSGAMGRTTLLLAKLKVKAFILIMAPHFVKSSSIW